MWLLVQVFGEDELADRLLARLLDQQFVDLGLTLLAQLFPVHQGLDLCARLAANQPDDGVADQGSCCSSNLRSAASVAISSTVTRT